MEVDYVRVWQRRPEIDGRTPLCPEVKPTISGPSIVCSNGSAFSLTNPISGGTWATSSSLSIVGSSTGNSATIKSGSAADWGIISYTYPQLQACPDENVVHKTVDAGIPKTPNVICARTMGLWGSNGVRYALTATRMVDNLPDAPRDYLSPTIFEWTISYGPNYSRNYHAFGQYISTPVVEYARNSGIRWTLKITNACGSKTFTGSRVYAYKGLSEENESETVVADFVDANITDSLAYEQAVNNRLSQTFIESTGNDEADDMAIETMINRVRMEELAPYLVLTSDDTTAGGDGMAGKPATASLTQEGTLLYPNPVKQLLHIRPGNTFDNSQPILIDIYDIRGKLVFYRAIDYGTTSMIDIAPLAPGIYNVNIRQGNKKEEKKLIKQ